MNANPTPAAVRVSGLRKGRKPQLAGLACSPDLERIVAAAASGDDKMAVCRHRHVHWGAPSRPSARPQIGMLCVRITPVGHVDRGPGSTWQRVGLRGLRSPHYASDGTLDTQNGFSLLHTDARDLLGEARAERRSRTCISRGQLHTIQTKPARIRSILAHHYAQVRRVPR